MCGIVGLRFETAMEASTGVAFEKALARLDHRGPDARGRFSDPAGLLLGATRLAIVDPAGGAQPFTSASGRHVLVYNGEIYNADDMGSWLRGRGIALRTRSDTEVVVESFEALGVDAFERLSGIFACLIWDRAERRLFVGRDALGVKPLYRLGLSDGACAFASEIKALAALADQPLRPDASGVLEYVSFQQTAGARTMFEGVSRVEPGVWEWQGGELRPRLQWSDLQLGAGDESADLEALREALDSAITRQVPGEVSFGVALSGGLDSSVVASSVTPTPRCYTGRFEAGPEYDESPWAKRVVEDRQAEWTVVTIDPEQCGRDLDAIITALDEPAAGPGALALYSLYREVGRHERVLWSGLGGDELFGGYVRHLLAWGGERWLGEGIAFERDGQVEERSRRRWPELTQLVGYEPLWTRFAEIASRRGLREAYWGLLQRSGPLTTRLRPEWREESDQVTAMWRARFDERTRDDFLAGVLTFEAETSLQALLQVEDRLSMAHSVEARVPLLDPDWVAAVRRVRPSERMPGGRLKGLLRDVAADRVPRSILERRDKKGFPTPLSLWARGPWKPWLEERLLDPQARVKDWFEPSAIEATVQGATDGPARQIWALLCLELWLQRWA